MKANIQIILADDHVMFLEGLQALLSAVDDIKIVATANSGTNVMELLKKEKADIVVTDINMPDMDGIKLNAEIKKHYPHIKTLILSTYSDPDKIIRLTNEKANGYLLKNAEKDELLKAIYTIQSGTNYFSKEVQDKLASSIFGQHKQEVTLSKREKEVLKYIAAEYSTAQIAEQLCISEHTVDTHRKNLTSKLGVKNVAGLVKYALQSGIADQNLTID